MVRVRNLVLAIAAATALTTEVAHALGLGEVTLKSALNQPLVAEIELLDVKGLGPGEVIPSLAAAEDFNRVGIDRPYFLTDLTFTPVLRPDGKNVIRVSSSKPVREPYLNFLVEVLWPNGRLLREYTLLLDPPLYSPETAVAVAPQLPIATPAPRVRAPAQTAQQPRAASAPGTTAAAGDQYRVSPNDTLWEIAERTRQGGTVHQAMLAIQDLNPDAFIDGNINRMKNGQVLRLPSAEQIASRSQSEAIEQVAQQNAAWRQARGGQAVASQRQLDATQRTTAGAAPTRSETRDSLRLVAPESGRSTSGSDIGTRDVQALRDKLAVAEESLDSSRRENRELNDRLQDLQGQLDKLQRLMALKDDQLARLQAQLGEGEGEGEAQSAAPDSVDSESEVEQSTDTTATGETADAEVVQPVGEETTEPQAAAPQEQPVVAPVQVEEPKPVAQKEPAPAPRPVTPVAPPEEPSFVDQMMANPLMLAVLGGSALLLLLGGLMALSRRNAMKEAELQESLLAENSNDNLDVGKPALDMPDLGLGASSSSTAEEPMDSIAGMANDPIAEADIYIAYGRFNQAADLLQNAVNDEPNRADLRLKLMEVYAELGDNEGFARQEAELRDIGGANAQIEQLKSRYPAMLAAAGVAVAAVGAAQASGASDIDSFSLDNFGLDQPEPAAVAGQDMDDAFDLSLDDLELDSDFGAPVAEVSDSQPAEANERDELDELDLDELTLEASAPEQPLSDFSFDLDEPATSDSETSLEDELASFSLDLPEEKTSETPPTVEANSDETLGSLDDFSFDLSESESSADPVGEAEIMPEAFDLSLDDAPTTAEPADDGFVAELNDIEAELDDLARGLEVPLDLSGVETGLAGQDDTAELPEEPAMTTMTSTSQAGSADSTLDALADDDFDFLAETDETTTKLDLARAYIDMGDVEGARDILDEVLSEGSDIQQQEAREMLAKLA